MTSPRTRRLLVDAELMHRRFAGWPVIEVTGTAGIPPEIYRVTYHLKGLYVDAAGNIVERATHLLEINLSLGYPRRAPQCRMLTPVFHPNFDDASVCIGDFWAASEGLDDLVIRIGRMIAYQEYNVRSPLNGLAAKWAAENSRLLPIDNCIVAPPSQGSSEASESTQSAQHVPVVLSIEESSAREGFVDADPWNQRIVIETDLNQELG